MSLARRIEEYIKRRLLETGDAIELQRSDLAEIFHCVPSQINYVLSTRFTPTLGYLVESRRGGGGYLRIIKLSWEQEPESDAKQIYENVGLAIDQWDAQGVLKRLYEEDFLTSREYHILKAITSRETLQVDLPHRDIIRARIMQAILTSLNRNDL